MRYEVAGRSYEQHREARMVVCNAQRFTRKQCYAEADSLFPEG